MASITTPLGGGGINIEALITTAFHFIVTLSTYAYDKANGFITFITSHFHYDRPREMLALSLIFLLSIVLLIAVIGGYGVQGDYTAEGSGSLQMGSRGVKIGSGESVQNLDNGVSEIGEATTTVSEDEETTSTIGEEEGDELTCSNTAQCNARYGASNSDVVTSYCCPVGDCANYCISDVLDTCQTSQCQAGYDFTYDPPICFEPEVCIQRDYADALAMCDAGYCVKTLFTVYLSSPSNNSLFCNDADTVTFKWI